MKSVLIDWTIEEEEFAENGNCPTEAEMFRQTRTLIVSQAAEIERLQEIINKQNG